MWQVWEELTSTLAFHRRCAGSSFAFNFVDFPPVNHPIQIDRKELALPNLPGCDVDHRLEVEQTT